MSKNQGYHSKTSAIYMNNDQEIKSKFDRKRNSYSGKNSHYLAPRKKSKLGEYKELMNYAGIMKDALMVSGIKDKKIFNVCN